MDYYGLDANKEIIKRMEIIIAKHCSNKNYSIGNYRQPVHFKSNGKGYKTKGNYYAGVSYEDIQSMYYTFGVHKMEIGKALLEILDFIERELNAEIDYFDDGKD